MPSTTSLRRPGGICAIALGALSAIAGAQPKTLDVYMHKGRGAISILDDAEYQRILRDAIFKDHNATIDTTSGKAAFLERFFASDLVYLSVHANPEKLVAANGDEVYIADLARAYREGGQEGPQLVIVTGCNTIEGPAPKVNMAAAVGVPPDVEDKAYLGFKSFTPGLFADRYFRVFLATWLRAKPDGGYRTLQEAQTDAKATVTRMLEVQKQRGSAQLGEVARFAPLDAMVADWIVIIGDAGLKCTDLK